MYKKEKRSWMKHLDFIIIDIICFQLAFIFSFFIRLGVSNPYANEFYRQLGVALFLIQICVLFFTEPYKGILRRTKGQELQAVVVNCISVFVGILVFLYGTQQAETSSRQIIFVYGAFSVFASYFGHCCWKIIVRRRFVREKRMSVMILVTTSDLVEECVRDFEDNRYREYSVDGVVVVDKPMEGQSVRGIPVVANSDNFFEYVRTNVVDEVFINGNTVSSSEALAEELIEMGVTVHFKLAHESKLMPNRVIEQCGHYLVMTCSMKIASPKELFFKRCMDILGSLVGMLLMGIAFIIFAPVIKYQSKSTVFFSQTRIGRNGRRFKIYKFRTMYPDAEQRKKELMKQNEMDGLMFKMEKDPRIIPIGHFLRKASIDELPQFWNVLKGDMSLVGTRPPTEDEFQLYEVHHRARLGIKPGLTGMWQVNGRSNIKDFERVVKLDTYYITNWSLSLDLKILLKTVKVVLTGDGSR